MFQMRGLSDTDPWAQAAQDDGPGVQVLPAALLDVGSKLKATFFPGPTVEVAMTTPTPGTEATTVAVKPRAWYFTPFGIAAILAGAFVGWKYVLPKLRK